MPIAMAEWNLLNAAIIKAQSDDTFQANLCNTKHSTYFFKK